MLASDGWLNGLPHIELTHAMYFDRTRFVLGKPCRNDPSHLWYSTGQTLRLLKPSARHPGGFAKTCYFCTIISKVKHDQTIEKFKKPIGQPVTLLHPQGFVAFDYQAMPLLMAHVRYELTHKPGTTSVEVKTCVNGHYWMDWQHSLNRECRKTECYVCRIVQDMKAVDDGTINQRAADYKRRKPEVIKAIRKRRYWKVREEVLAYSRSPEGRAESNERQKKRYKTPRGRSLVLAAAKRSKLKRLAAKQDSHVVVVTQKEYDDRLTEFNGCCAYCGVEMNEDKTVNPQKLTWEHFLDRSHRGPHCLSNLLPVCWRCNCSKGNRDVYQWFSSQSFFCKARWKFILKVLGKTEKTIHQIPLF